MTKDGTENLGWLNRINLIYGAIGIFLFAAFTANGVKSFIIGWGIAVVNLELLKRLGLMMASLYRGEELGSMFYFVLFGKFLVWAGVIAVCSMINGLQAVPFIFGTTTLIVSGFGFGVKEYLYARAS